MADNANYCDFLSGLKNLTDIQKEVLFQKLCSEVNFCNNTLEQNADEPTVIKVDNVEVIDKPVNEVDCCLHCGSVRIKKHGTTKGGIQRYICKDCGKSFNANHGLITHYTHLSTWQWQEIIRGTIECLSITKIAKNIKTSTSTVWTCRLKIYQTLQNIYGYCDRFNNITEVDGKYERISFKGTRDKKFFIEKLVRLPRHHMTYTEKLKYITDSGCYDDLQKKPHIMYALLHPKRSDVLDPKTINSTYPYVCILTAIDRVNNIYLEPIESGKPTAELLATKLQPRIDPDSVVVTDKLQSYELFTKTNNIEHIQVDGSTHISPSSAYSLGRVNALHSNLDRFMSKELLNMPATKYIDLYLIMFWWLQKNKALNTKEMFDRLYNILTGKVDISTRSKMQNITAFSLNVRVFPVDISKFFI